MCELSGPVRAKFRPEHRDYGYGDHHKQLRIDRTIELHEAKLRGTSARHDQLGIIATPELSTLLGMKKIETKFHDRIQKEYDARTAKS